MPTPWDLQPVAPIPSWVADVANVLAVLTKVEQASQTAVADVFPIYSQQQQLSQIFGYGGMPQVAGQLGRLADLIRGELFIQGEVKLYKISVKNWALNQPFYDSHPDPKPEHSFPVMPVDLVLYIKNNNIVA